MLPKWSLAVKSNTPSFVTVRTASSGARSEQQCRIWSRGDSLKTKSYAGASEGAPLVTLTLVTVTEERVLV